MSASIDPTIETFRECDNGKDEGEDPREGNVRRRRGRGRRAERERGSEMNE